MSDGLDILIVDDEESIRHSLLSVLTKRGHTVRVAASGQDALASIQQMQFDAALVDLRMPQMDGLKLLKHIQQIAPEIVVVVMTAFSSIESAVEAMRSGAYDYVTKPFEIDDIEITLRRGVTQRRLGETEAFYRERAQAPYALDKLVGQSAVMQRVREMIQTVANVDTTVLITGESGTGKELVAGAIHRLSPRSRQPFIAVNCGAIAHELLESELFGHVRGAFTGASSDRKGLFESADGGTLFLDEIGEITPEMQVQLLRVIEQQELRRVGSSKPLRVNVRIVTSTNCNLQQAAAQGAFRSDLYYRLNIFPIVLPPLRERREDILPLAEHFLDLHSKHLQKPHPGIPPRIAERLISYDWPGNVRELENMAERAVLLGDPEALVPQQESAPRDESFYNLPLKIARDAFERRYLIRVLRRYPHNITGAARQIGVHRTTLYDLLRKHEIDTEIDL